MERWPSAGWSRSSFGGLLLFDTDNEAFEISVPIVIFTAALLGSFFVWIVSKAVQTRHRAVHTGSEELIGARGEVRSRSTDRHVFVQGRAVAGHAATGRWRSGQKVVVRGRERPHADRHPRSSDSWLD